MANRFGGDNIDDFINNEMQNINGGADSAATKPTMRPSAGGSSGPGGAKAASSKPNFGFSMSSKKSGGAFAKPSFAMMGGSKKVGGAGPSAGPPVISKASFNPSGAGPPKITMKRRQ